MNYLLLKSAKRKKTICIQVRRDGAVVVQAPVRTSKKEIEAFLEEKKGWLKKRLREQQEQACREKAFVSGETFLFLGKSYPLYVVDAREHGGNGAPLVFSSGRFLLRREYASQGKTLFEEWYRGEAHEYITERVRRFGAALWCFPGKVRLSNAQCRWGSCSADNCLSFSWRLIMAPPPVIDYVILHELVHMREKSHSRRFWNLLETLFPGYRLCRTWLRENGHHLDF